MFKQNKVPKEQWWNRNKMIEATKELYEEYHKKLAQNDLHGLSSIVSNRVMLVRDGNKRLSSAFPHMKTWWNYRSCKKNSETGECCLMLIMSGMRKTLK